MNSLQEFVRNKEHIYCYGIGAWGKKITRLLNNLGIKISAYIVTSKENEPLESYNGTPIYDIDMLQITSLDGIILATIHADFKEAMKRVINEKSACKSVYWFMDYKDTRALLQKELKRKRKKEIRRRAKQNIFHYLALANSMEYPVLEKDFARQRVISSNIAYGNDKCIKKYLRMPNYDTRKCTILHAAWVDTMYTDGELNPLDGNFFTMSEEMIRSYRDLAPHVRTVYSTGPYILYARPMLSYGRLRKIKQKLGKTLLVVPQHTVADLEFSYSKETFLREIERVRIKYNFDTVMVCLYYVDVKKREYNLYKKEGYKIVCAGHPADSNFIRRIRTFIELANVSMGNTAMGTFLGYSIALNTPHYLFENHSIEICDYDIYEKVGYRSLGGKDKDQMIHRKITEQFKQAFSVYSEQITEKQMALVEKYWGKWKRKVFCRKL